MEIKKIMLYQTEDKSAYGYKPTQFNFKVGSKVINQETGKIFIVEGIYNFMDSDFIKFKQVFRSVKKSKHETPTKIHMLKQFAILSNVSI